MKILLIAILAVVAAGSIPAWAQTESSFYGTYRMVHADWIGTLTLHDNTKSPVNDVMGTYVGSDGKRFDVDGMINDRIPSEITLYIDWGRGPEPMTGYLCDRGNAIAGMYYYGNTPYGWYAVKT
jgi:hypothetical protein